MSTYDGSTDGVDLNGSVSLASTSTQLVATWNVDGPIPVAGDTTPPDGTSASYDLPDKNFVGGNYFALFQNKTIQTNVAYPACPQKPPRPTPVLQRFGTWQDGHHFFVAFSASWDGTKWVHSAQLGQYFPGPDGGYSFFELGTNNGSGWTAANTHHSYGTDWSVSLSANTISVTAPGVYKSPDTTNCDPSAPFFNYKFASPGDVIANVKALTTANQVVTLPVPVPLSDTCSLPGGLICESDLTTVGGFVFYVDTTSGNSWAGLANSNITGIAYSGGAVGVSDTLGAGHQCPTPTVGGAIPQNPLFVPNQDCHIDDDEVSRGSFLSEFWDTVNGFTF